MLKKIALLAALVSLLGNTTVSAAATDIPPAGPAPKQIEVTLTQPELAVDVPDTGGAVAAGVGGILGALIGAAINKAAVANAEKRVAEMRNALVDYHFNDRFEQALRAKLAAADLAPAPSVEYLRSVRGRDELIAANAVPRTGLLVLTPRYAITSDFERLSVKVQATTLDRTLKGEKVKERYRAFNSYVYSFPMKRISGSDATEDSKRWVELGGTEMAAMFEEGIDQVTDMIVYDQTSAGQAEAATKVTRQGRTVGPTPDRQWQRTRLGMTATHPIDGTSKEFSERDAARIAAAKATTPVTSAAALAPAATPVAAPVETSAAPAANAPIAAPIKTNAAPAANAPAAAPAAAPADASAALSATTEVK